MALWRMDCGEASSDENGEVMNQTHGGVPCKGGGGICKVRIGRTLQ